MPTKPRSHKTPTLPQRDDRRPSAWRRGYDARWRKLRLRILLRDLFLCQECGRPTGTSGHVDHRVPHQGQGDPLYWDESNLWVLCVSCHTRKTITVDRRGFGKERK